MVFVQNQSRNGHIVVAFGQVEVEKFIDLVNFEACRKDVFAAFEPLGDVVRVVVLVLDVAKDFLDDVLKRNDAARAAELIDDDRQRLLLREENLHQFLRHHRFGNEGNVDDRFAPVGRVSEHFRRVDVALDMVDVVVIDEDFRVAALDEFLAQFVGGAVVSDGDDFRARNHAVADARFAEIEGVLEDFDLVVDVVVVLCAVDAGMDEIVEIDSRKFAFLDLLVHPNPENPKENLRQKRGKFAHGPQQNVAQIGGHGEEVQQSVGIAFEERFRQKFAREKHDEGR